MRSWGSRGFARVARRRGGVWRGASVGRGGWAGFVWRHGERRAAVASTGAEVFCKLAQKNLRRRNFVFFGRRLFAAARCPAALLGVLATVERAGPRKVVDAAYAQPKCCDAAQRALDLLTFCARARPRARCRERALHGFSRASISDLVFGVAWRPAVTNCVSEIRAAVTRQDSHGRPHGPPKRPLLHFGCFVSFRSVLPCLHSRGTKNFQPPAVSRKHHLIFCLSALHSGVKRRSTITSGQNGGFGEFWLELPCVRFEFS